MDFEITSWLYEVAQYLSSNTVGVFGNTITSNIFLQQLPDSPALAISLHATGGPNEPTGIDPLTRINLQVQVRRMKNLEGLRYAFQIFSLLDNKWNITTSYAERIVGDHLPGPFYRSASGLPVYTLNFRATLAGKGYFPTQPT